MAECRYKRWCRIEYDTDFDVCYPCVGDGNEACVSYEPMPDVKALLKLAEDMERAAGDREACPVLSFGAAALVADYAHRIREACGVSDDA